jgi:predicted kinase
MLGGKRGVVVVLVGLPGSGKSTWAAQRGAARLSSDLIRRLLVDDETDQTIHRHVFRVLRYLLRQRLILGRPVNYVDATNLTPAERAPYVLMAHLHGYAAEAVFFDVPVDECRARNERRPRVVPVEALEQMARKLVPPSLEEGFDRITVLK